jgi:hypothetical protein
MPLARQFAGKFSVRRATQGVKLKGIGVVRDRSMPYNPGATRTS